MSKDVGSNWPAIGCGKECKNARPIGVEIKSRRAVIIAPHRCKNSPRAEDKPRLVKFNYWV